MAPNWVPKGTLFVVLVRCQVGISFSRRGKAMLFLFTLSIHALNDCFYVIYDRIEDAAYQAAFQGEGVEI